MIEIITLLLHWEYQEYTNHALCMPWQVYAWIIKSISTLLPGGHLFKTSEHISIIVWTLSIYANINENKIIPASQTLISTLKHEFSFFDTTIKVSFLFMFQQPSVSFFTICLPYHLASRRSPRVEQCLMTNMEWIKYIHPSHSTCHKTISSYTHQAMTTHLEYITAIHKTKTNQHIFNITSKTYRICVC